MSDKLNRKHVGEMQGWGQELGSLYRCLMNKCERIHEECMLSNDVCVNGYE